jgi:hypothetical protein
MTRITAGEMLAQAADLHYEWSDRYAEQVPVDPDGAEPNEDGESDYNEHHHTVSAPPEIDDQLNAKLFALVEQRQRDVEGRHR